MLACLPRDRRDADKEQMRGTVTGPLLYTPALEAFGQREEDEEVREEESGWWWWC